PDLARFSLWLLQELRLEKVCLLGTFIGGWLAAEMAVMSPQVLDRLVLVDAAGVQPQQGGITDIFFHRHEGKRDLIYFRPQQHPGYQTHFGRQPTPAERKNPAEK